MARRMFGHALFYGLGVGSAVVAALLLGPALHGGIWTAAGSGSGHAVMTDGAARCPYLSSPGSGAGPALEGGRAGTVCPYLEGRAGRCPYLRERALERSGPEPLPRCPALRGDVDRGQDSPRAGLRLASIQSGGLTTAGWF